MITDEITERAMKIILSAGEARTASTQALKAVSEANFELADEKLKEANQKILIAHRVQTDAIQAETSGEPTEYTVLFAHAQDTLMTIYSELNITKQLIRIFKSYEKRIENIEEALKNNIGM